MTFYLFYYLFKLIIIKHLFNIYALLDIFIYGDWGLGIGDWGLGIGGLGLGPQPPNPKPKTQNPKPKPQVLKKFFYIKKFLKNKFKK